VNSPSQKPLADNPQHSQQTDIHASPGFEPTIPASTQPQDLRVILRFGLMSLSVGRSVIQMSLSVGRPVIQMSLSVGRSVIEMSLNISHPNIIEYRSSRHHSVSVIYVSLIIGRQSLCTKTATICKHVSSNYYIKSKHLTLLMYWLNKSSNEVLCTFSNRFTNNPSVKNTNNTATSNSVLCLKHLKNRILSRRNVGVTPESLSSDLFCTVLYS